MWEHSEELKELAKKIIAIRDEVVHVDINEVLFIKEYILKPRAMASCYKIDKHPIQVFTDAKYAIVFYWQHCDVLSENQLALLMLHELMHIPPLDTMPLVDHTIQDFRTILEIDLNWDKPGQEVPSILEGD